MLMQGTGASGYNGCEKNGGSSEKGDFTEHLPLPVFCEKWVLQIESILCYTVLDKTKNEV